MELFVAGRPDEITAFLNALASAGVRGTDHVTIGAPFHGKCPVTVNYEAFGLYNPVQHALTVFPVETPAAAESEGE